ncbi:MAG: lipopolysaccharide core heptose(I) kinase RfaP [Gammaproteobacteria bacterium RIFCSPHIGHO2_12_FULL_37_14]|nr:MAG: lipopolysaccharide core heptose(I) kinase RfaP [Gammaproteobacteria bacterium RIFCSPHIGHO2_12_FULL_37_14]
MKVYLENHIKQFFSTKQPYFEQMMSLTGECFRQREGRKTQRIRLGEKMYFIKQYHGVGWKEIFKNLSQLRWPVLGANNEWLAIKKVQLLDVPTAKVVAFGQHGYNPATLKSFILMEELSPTISLENLCQQWQRSTPTFSFKKALIKRVAEIARQLHGNGINHRDFYICHFLLDLSQKYTKNPHLYLIDLHRAQIRQKTPLRWIVKDLGSLYFSSKEVGLTQRDLFRFMKIYSGTSLRGMLATKKTFWQAIKKRGEKLYGYHA